MLNSVKAIKNKSAAIIVNIQIMFVSYLRSGRSTSTHYLLKQLSRLVQVVQRSFDLRAELRRTSRANEIAFKFANGLVERGLCCGNVVEQVHANVLPKP